MLKGLLLSCCALLVSFGPVKMDEGVTNWINRHYVKCLEKKLPCECEKEVGTYFVMHLDPNHSTIRLLRYEDFIEDETYRIEAEAKNSYKVIDLSKDVHVTVGKATIRGTKLSIRGMGNRVITFDYYGTSKFSNDIKYSKQNISLLNEALKKRAYDPLEKILNDTSLNCHCSKHDGEIKNIIWNDSESKSWTLELKNDSMFIYINKIIVGREIDQNDSILLKKIIGYKWR